MPEKQFKRRLIVRAGIGPGDRVLDVGAGSGTLAILAKEAQPAAIVHGADGDPAILGMARRKAERVQARIAFTVADVTALPYPAEYFDCSLSSLVLSLLNMEDKRRAVREAYRVLRPGGEIYVADYGPPHTRWGRFVAPWVRTFGPTAENLRGVLPSVFEDVGLERVEQGEQLATLFGTLAIVSGRKPG